MIITGISRLALEASLDQTNRQYSNNIRWNRPPEPLNQRGDRFRLTLRCVSSKGRGHRLGRWLDRRMVSACWHVHGNFFDAVFDHNPDAVIRAGSRVICQGENWQDYNIGSAVFPLMASEACEC